MKRDVSFGSHPVRSISKLEIEFHQLETMVFVRLFSILNVYLYDKDKLWCNSVCKQYEYWSVVNKLFNRFSSSFSSEWAIVRVCYIRAYSVPTSELVDCMKKKTGCPNRYRPTRNLRARGFLFFFVAVLSALSFRFIINSNTLGVIRHSAARSEWNQADTEYK